MLLIVFGKGGGIEKNVVLLLAFGQTMAHAIVVGRRDIDGGSEHGHLQLIGTVVLGEHTVAVDTTCLDNGAGNRRQGRSIEHTALHHTGVKHFLLGGYHTSCLLLLFSLVFLCRNTKRESHHQRDSPNDISFHSHQLFNVTILFPSFLLTNLGFEDNAVDTQRGLVLIFA